MGDSLLVGTLIIDYSGVLLLQVIQSMQITFTLTDNGLLIFLQSGVEKLLSCLGIELTIFDLDFQLVAFDNLTTRTPECF